ncbi:MAG: sigma-70 family RNA polymerase sigma factor [Clostridia bacterium]|nr:sigma-70 family RNA polymerase sigma factor [Clostridia bacterium]
MEQYEAFNRVYDATRDALLRWLIPRIRSGADVEDLMQEIYRKLWRKLNGSGVREPEKYVFGIAKRELARFYRRRAERQSREAPLDGELPEESREPEDVVLDAESERAIWEIVKAEPLLSYQAFTLYYGFSVPTETIAKELGLSEDAVRKRLSRTRARIRQQLNALKTDVPEEERKGAYYE